MNPWAVACAMAFVATASAQIEVKYSRVSLEGLQALSGDKTPKSAAIYSARACNVGSSEEELSDGRIMMMSPVPVDDQRIPVLARARERGVRKLTLVRDIVGVGALGVSLFGRGDAADLAKIVSGAAAAGLTLLDSRVSKRGAVPDVAGQLQEGGPRFRLGPNECRAGWFVGLFLRDFTQHTVRFDNPKPAPVPVRATVKEIETVPRFEVRI